jgi:hypothetical protein
MVEKMRSQSQNILQTSGSDVGYQYATINSHMLGFGEPVRVKKGQHVLFRLLNASATENTMLALPGHSFRIIAMDGNPIIAILVISSGGLLRKPQISYLSGITLDLIWNGRKSSGGFEQSMGDRDSKC